MLQALQSVTAITKCNNYYKVRRDKETYTSKWTLEIRHRTLTKRRRRNIVIFP